MQGAIKVGNPGTGWMAELGVAFFFGFVIASILWLGLWFLLARPAHTARLKEGEATLRAKEVSLEQCLSANRQLNAVQTQLQAENKALSAKLDEALKGWGRCIKASQLSTEKVEPPAAEGPQ